MYTLLEVPKNFTSVNTILFALKDLGLDSSALGCKPFYAMGHESTSLRNYTQLCTLILPHTQTQSSRRTC